MVVTDKQRLQQVLLSYQSNALKFTPVNGFIKIKASKIMIDEEELLEVTV